MVLDFIVIIINRRSGIIKVELLLHSYILIVLIYNKILKSIIIK